MAYRLDKLLGLLLLFLVLALAFLLASFPARNSHVWLHLARGRLLAHGESPSGTNPDLAFDVLGNQTWLYDLCLYGCSLPFGNSGLVVGKALLAAGIAFVLFKGASVSDGRPVSHASGSFCTSLALLTMSPYLRLQPAMVSYMFMALVLVYLEFARSKWSFVRSLMLAALFIVWANVDRWFVLGLGVVALAWVGELLDTAFTSGPIACVDVLLRRGLWLSVLAAACLINPSRMHAFDWFSRRAAYSAASPFDGAYFARVGGVPVSLAYFLLLGLSLVSFVVLLPNWRWRRFLPWFGLALLSAWQVLTIPFFAVAACLVLAWNIEDIFARRRSRAVGVSDAQDPSLTLLSRTGAALTSLLLLVLVVCAWPGWLQSPPYGPRSWAFDLSPSLERGAAAVRRWREEHKLAAGSGGLHLCADTVYAFAWFCPTEKRLLLSDYGSAVEWRQQIPSPGVRYLVVYDPDRDRLYSALSGLVADAEQWPLLYQEGDLAIFGWRDPQAAASPAEHGEKGGADPFRGWQLDLNRLAFHPAENKRAPAEAPASQTAAWSWLDAFRRAAQPRSIDRDEAVFHLLHAEALQRLAAMRHASNWENAQAAGLLGAAGAWTSPAQGVCNAALRLALLGILSPESGASSGRPSALDRIAAGFQKGYVWQRDDAPPSLYYLAVRAARRAVAANPEDASAYFLLGESYLGLLHATRERAWAGEMRQLMQLRQAQASAALNRALVLRPDFLQAHLHLGRLYQEMDFLDLAVSHRQKARRLARLAGPPAGVSPEEFQSSQAQNEKELDRLAEEVRRRADAALLTSADRPTRQQAIVSFQNGLAGKALELLLASHLSAFGSEGMDLELELLLGVGRPWDVQQWLRPEHEYDLGPVSYNWFRVRAAAASGDYAKAEAECAESARLLAQSPGGSRPVPLRERMALEIAILMLNGWRSQDPSFAKLAAATQQAVLAARLQDQSQWLMQQADWTTLGGLIALEEGEAAKAERAFRDALPLWGDKSKAASGGGLDFKSRIIAQSYLQWMK